MSQSTTRVLAALFGAFSLWGCEGIGSTGGAADTGGGGTGGAADTGGGGTGGAADTGGGGTGGGVSAGEGGFGEGCRDTSDCAADEFCDYEYDWCGPPPWGENFVACMSRDATCDRDLPVCGCDRQVYDSQCAAQAAGVDIGGSTEGREYCDHALTPQGRFACGPWFCDAAVSFCYYGDGDSGDRFVECSPLPEACAGVGTCDCVATSSRQQCSTVEGNGVTGVLIYEVLL